MIKQIAHVITTINEATKFYEIVRNDIEILQNEGLVVEIQYQQSDEKLSALLLGIEPETRNYSVNAIDANKVKEVLHNTNI